MKIKLVNPIKELIPSYEGVVKAFINSEKITLEEWNSRLKNFRDDYGYSIIHYFESVAQRLDVFVTLNPIMLENREELKERFGVKIMTPEELNKKVAKQKK